MQQQKESSNEIDRLKLELATARVDGQDALKKADDSSEKWTLERKDLQTQVATLEHERNLAKEEADKLRKALEQVERSEREQRAEAAEKAEVAERLTRDLTKAEAARQELQEHQMEMHDRLKMTEYQLIQAKSSWAESEHEREQLFNRVQELLEERNPSEASRMSIQPDK